MDQKDFLNLSITSVDLDYVLPCDVRIPPKTIISAGCTLRTLLIALTLPERPEKFKEEERKLRVGDYCCILISGKEMIAEIISEGDSYFAVTLGEGRGGICLSKDECKPLTPFQHLQLKKKMSQ